MPTSGFNPFVGPRPLERKDGALGGRDTEIRELKWYFTAERIVWLHGPSGAGKTSLLQAGLIPALEDDGFIVLPTIRLSTPPAGAGNRYLDSTLASLSAAGNLHDVLAPAGDTRARVLLFDQFEEALTLDPTDGTAKESFFRQLAQALALRHVWALFVVREDYLPAFSHLARYLPGGMNNRFRLNLLSKQNASIAIQKIASASTQRRFLLEAADRLAFELTLIRDLHSGQWVEGPTVEPVLLQVVCRTLWDSLPASVTEITAGHVPTKEQFDKVLQSFYAGCVVADPVRKFPFNERQIRDWIEAKLITGTVRNVFLESAITPKDPPVDLLKALVNTRLLRREPGSHTWYELAHDRLIEPVKSDNRQWYEKHLNWFQKRAAVWELKARSKTFLLSDAELAEAELWIQQAKPVLTPAETQFRQDSRDAAENRKTLRRWINLAWFFAIAVAIAGALAIVFHLQSKTRELISHSRLVPQEPESAGRAIESGLQALAQASWLDAGLRRDAIEALNEALQRKSPFHGARNLTAAVQNIFPAPNRLGIATSDEFAFYDIPGLFPADHETRATWVKTEGCRLNQAVLAADGRTAYLGLSDGNIRQVDLSKSGNFTCAAGGIAVQSLAVSKLGSIAVANDTGELKLDGRILSVPKGRVQSLAFRPDGQRLAVGLQNGVIAIYDNTGTPLLAHLTAEKDKSITTLVWGKGVLVAGSNQHGDVHLWDDAGKPLRRITHTFVPDLGIQAADVSPNGAYIATTGATTDRQTKLWRTADPASPPLVLQAPAKDTEILSAVAFMDDDHLLVATTIGNVRIYYLKSEDLRQAATQRLRQP